MSIAFCGVIKLKDDSDIIEFSRALNLECAKSGYGIQFWVDRFNSEDIAVMIEKLSERFPSDVEFNLLAYPLQCNADEIFNELNPMDGSDPCQSNFIAFLRRFLSLPGIKEIAVALWEMPGAEFENQPVRRISKEDFVSHFCTYWESRWDRVSPHGIFVVDLSTG